MAGDDSDHISMSPWLKSTSATPKEAAFLVWIVPATVLVIVFALLADGQGNLVRLAIPGGAAVVGLVYYLQRPIAYVYFSLWTWFLTPLVRRLVDWRMGFEDHNLILLAPVLVSAVAGLTLLRERRSAGALRLTPFLLCIAGVLYGFMVGLVRWHLHASEAISAGEIVYALFDWLAPLLLGLHLCIRWSMYDLHRKAVEKSFLVAILVLGSYGVYQYVSPPAWDTLWLEHMIADLGLDAMGRPEPFQIRVWGTLNNPGIFANMLMAGLLFLFSVRSKVKSVAMGVGYSAFLLTLVRTSWLGWLVGLVVLARGSKGGQVRRLLLWIALLPVLVAPLMLNPEIAAVVSARAQTMQDTGHDESYQDRAEEYRALLTGFWEDPFGEGLNNQLTFHGYIMDSGVIRLLYSCGWVGTGLFLAGVAVCVWDMPSASRGDTPIDPVYRAIVIAMLCELLSGNTFTGPSGAVTWICIGLAFAYKSAQLRSSQSAEVELPSPSPRGELSAIA